MSDREELRTPSESVTVSNSGNVAAANGGLGNSGIINGNVKLDFHAAPRAEPQWPLLVGQPPALASAFQFRPGLRDTILGTCDRGEPSIVQDTGPVARGTRVLAGGGGVGKSQLAAWFVQQALDDRTADLVIWVDASHPDRVVSGYARAAERTGVAVSAGDDPVSDARALLEWLHTTDRAWLVVLDDITDPAHLSGWWPPVGTVGWTLATTRLRDSTLISSGRQQVDIDVYTLDESVTYLTERLTGAAHTHLLDERTADLAVAVGHLPLALSHAAAYMINRGDGCSAYLARYAARDGRLGTLMPASADPDAYGRPVAVTLLLNLEAADRTEPLGLATPALAVAAMCDPNGHPEALWATAPIAEYLTSQQFTRARTSWLGRLLGHVWPRRQVPTNVTAEQAHQVVRLLHRYGLISHTVTDNGRAVRIHALTARAAREAIPGTSARSAAVRAAADALRELWPEDDHVDTDLIAALRANSLTLAEIAGELLWHPRGHELLFRTGESLLLAGHYQSAVVYWHRIATQARTSLGEEHRDTLAAHENLAVSDRKAGHAAKAIPILERVAEQFTRLIGSEHVETLIARGNLAVSYLEAGRTSDAISGGEQLVADCARLLGEEDRHTLNAYGDLAEAYRHAGRTADAIEVNERVVDGRLRLFGADHPYTLVAKGNLASSYVHGRRITDAITILEGLVPESDRILGPDHPETLAAASNLAAAYHLAGRIAPAIVIEERVVDDYQRRLGNEHPATLSAWANLAASYRQAGHPVEAAAILEPIVAGSWRLLGRDHPDTLTAEAGLAAAYREAGNTDHAIALEERVVQMRRQLAGQDHPDTLNAQANLADSYRQAGRIADAVIIQEQVLAASVRLLGDEHPDTLTAQTNLGVLYQQAGRVNEAIALHEGTVVTYTRLAGPDHPATLNVVGHLAESYHQGGRVADAVTTLERLATFASQRLGKEHPGAVYLDGVIARWREQ